MSRKSQGRAILYEYPYCLLYLCKIPTIDVQKNNNDWSPRCYTSLLKGWKLREADIQVILYKILLPVSCYQLFLFPLRCLWEPVYPRDDVAFGVENILIRFAFGALLKRFILKVYMHYFSVWWLLILMPIISVIYLRTGSFSSSEWVQCWFCCILWNGPESGAAGSSYRNIPPHQRKHKSLMCPFVFYITLQFNNWIE